MRSVAFSDSGDSTNSPCCCSDNELLSGSLLSYKGKVSPSLKLQSKPPFQLPIMHFSLIAVCGLLTAAIATPTANSKRHVVHERRERLPAHWKRSTKLHGDSSLPMRIALTQNNLDRADEFLMDIAHPESPNYGKHVCLFSISSLHSSVPRVMRTFQWSFLNISGRAVHLHYSEQSNADSEFLQWSAKQVAETFAPSQESYASVLNWLSEHGIAAERVKQSQSLSWLQFDATVSEAEDLLNTQYFEYKHATTGQAHVACEEYSLPEDIKKHIDLITPTVHFDAKVESPKKGRKLNQDEVAIVKRQTSTTGHNVQPGIGHSIGSPGSKSLPKSGGKISTIINELEHCDVSIVPDCLRALYEFPSSFPTNAKSKSAFSSELVSQVQ
jgi:tripeptidyl-peptidase-1